MGILHTNKCIWGIPLGTKSKFFKNRQIKLFYIFSFVKLIAACTLFIHVTRPKMRFLSVCITTASFFNTPPVALCDFFIIIRASCFRLWVLRLFISTNNIFPCLNIILFYIHNGMFSPIVKDFIEESTIPKLRSEHNVHSREKSYAT